LAESDWIEIDFLRLLSKHVVSCVAALLAYGLIGSVAFLVLAAARRLGWLAEADLMVESLVTYCEVFVLGGIFVFSTVWFIIDLLRYRRLVRGGRLFCAFLVA
jgi:hypothetical protein